MTLTDGVEAIIVSMEEAAQASIIDERILVEINALRSNGFDTQALFGIRSHEFIMNKFNELPLEVRVAWFNHLALKEG